MTKELFIRFCIVLVLQLFSETVIAEPADPSLRRQIKLPDGKLVEAILVGDEYGCFWKLTDGSDNCYIEVGDDKNQQFVPVDGKALLKRAKQRRVSETVLARASRIPTSALKGRRSVPVLLVQFADVTFSPENTPAFFSRFFNEQGFSEGRFKGSVRDYFLSQSNKQLDLQFDVYGPYTLSKSIAYYGEDKDNSKQPNMQELLDETLQQADEDVDFSQYDWTGDGQVEQFVIVYAGLGQSVGGGSETIWPHKSTSLPVALDKVVLGNYCCGPELRLLNDEPVLNGIGTICHEFSHCLGLPDMYDNYSINYGTKYWDLMDQGVHNDNGYTPAGYTGYCKMALGWQQPVVLNKDCHVSNMKPMSENGRFYMIRNDNHPDEYYLLENRQLSGWDAATRGHGLLILHVDYDPVFFDNPNRTKGTSNTHPRCAIVNADADETIDFKDYKAFIEDLQGDLYGYKNHALTDNSKPAATLYNMNIDGSLLLGKSVTNITESSTGVLSFDFANNIIKKDIYMLGVSNQKLRYLSDEKVSISATIKNYSASTYTRKVGVYVYGGGEWAASAVKVMNLEPQKSTDATFVLDGLEEGIDYQVAFYCYEDDASTKWKRITDYVNFTMDTRNKYQLSVVGLPKLTLTSSTTATLDVVLRNESMLPYTRYLGVFTWRGQTSQQPRNTLSSRIEPYSEASFHFELSGIDPNVPSELRLYYLPDSQTSSWSSLFGPIVLYTGNENFITHLRGDANGDGKVDSADVSAIVNHILGNTPDDFIVDMADYNGDGNVDVVDVAGIIGRVCK